MPPHDRGAVASPRRRVALGALSQLSTTSNHERGVLASVFYLAGSAMLAVAGLGSVASGRLLLVLAGVAAGVAVVSVAARALFVYGATVIASLLGPVLIAVAITAGQGGFGSALVATLYTFVAVHTALVLRVHHTAWVLAWSLMTALVANASLGSPVPGVIVAAVFLLVCGTLAAVTSWLVGQVRALATTDPLTGVANRASFEAALEHARATVSRTNEPLSLLALDLDGFKQLNDTYGHAAGDRALIEIAAAWAPLLRERDLLARVGGDEFCVILPDADGTHARHVARRLEHAMPAGTSCSTGVATLTEGGDLGDLCAAADQDLYAAKARNRWVRGPRTRGAAAS